MPLITDTNARTTVWEQEPAQEWFVDTLVQALAARDGIDATPVNLSEADDTFRIVISDLFGMNNVVLTKLELANAKITITNNNSTDLQEVSE